MQRFKSFLTERSGKRLHIHIHPEGGASKMPGGFTTQGMRPSTNIEDRRRQIMPGYQVTPQETKPFGGYPMGDPGHSQGGMGYERVPGLTGTQSGEAWGKDEFEGGETSVPKSTPWPDLKPGGSIRDYANKVTPRVAAGAGAGIAGAGRLTAALRWGKDVVAGKPGGAHSELAPYAADKGKPTEMGFVRKPTGSTDVGPHQGAFFTRPQASEIGLRHPDLLTDPPPPTAPKPKPWQAQSFDFKPEGGNQWNPASANPNPIQSPDAGTYAQKGKDIYQSSRELKQNPQDYLQKRGVPQETAPKPSPTSIKPEGGKKKSTPTPAAFPRSDTASNPPTEGGNKKRKEGGDEKEVMIPGKGFSSSVPNMRPSSNIDDQRDFMDKSQSRITGAVNKKFGTNVGVPAPIQHSLRTKALLAPTYNPSSFEGGQNMTDADRKNMPSPVYNQGSEYGWAPTAQVRMSQATRSLGHTGSPIDLSGPRSPGPPSTSFDNDTPKFTPSAIAPYRTKPDFDMTQKFRHSDNVVDRRGQIKPGYDVTPKLGMAHAGVNRAGETRQGSPGTQSGETGTSSFDSGLANFAKTNSPYRPKFPEPESGKKAKRSHEHGGMLFYGPHEK